jgi:hypothetical protein
MNVGEVLDTIEQTLLSRQLSSLERFILCQSWFGRGYSEMAPDCAYSIAHLKDIGSQLWQALSKAIGQRVTKKNLFLVLKQYLFSQTIQRGVGDRVQGSAVSAQRSTERSRRSPNGVERGEDEDCDPTALGDQERQRAVRDSDSESDSEAKPCLRPRGDAKGERASAKPCLPYPSGNDFVERASAFSVGEGRKHYEMLSEPLPTTVGSKDIKSPVTMLPWLPEWS